MSTQTTNDTPATAAPAAAPASAADSVAAPAASAEAQLAAAAAPAPAVAAAEATSAPAAPAAAPEHRQADATVPSVAAPKTEEKPEEKPATVEKPAEKTQTPLTSLFEKLPSILEAVKHKEMWGVQLSDSTHIPTTVVLQKFLRANDDNVSKAADQLQKALEWRRDTNPGKLLEEVSFDKKKFDELGYVTTHKDAEGKEVIITWNIYGAVKDKQATFGNVDEFIKWRAALMELSVRKLKLDKAQTPIPDGGEDPYQMIQVHDYLNVSFLRMDPAVKKASSETITVFAMAYPELLNHKYFVNIPALMGWVFKAMKLFLAPKTISKFHPLGYGAELANELPALKQSLPKEYGGSNVETIKTAGQTVKIADVAVPTPSSAAASATETKPAAEAAAPFPAAAPVPAKTKPTEAPVSAAAAPAAEPAAAAETAPVADAPAKTEAPKAEGSELPNVAELSIKDETEKEGTSKEEAKPTAA